jgi:hypothetical protein
MLWRYERNYGGNIIVIDTFFLQHLVVLLWSGSVCDITLVYGGFNLLYGNVGLDL